MTKLKNSLISGLKEFSSKPRPSSDEQKLALRLYPKSSILFPLCTKNRFYMTVMANGRVSHLHGYKCTVIIVVCLISAPNYLKTQIESKVESILVKNLSLAKFS